MGSLGHSKLFVFSLLGVAHGGVLGGGGIGTMVDAAGIYLSSGKRAMVSTDLASVDGSLDGLSRHSLQETGIPPSYSANEQ